MNLRTQRPRVLSAVVQHTHKRPDVAASTCNYSTERGRHEDPNGLLASQSDKSVITGSVRQLISKLRQMVIE